MLYHIEVSKIGETFSFDDAKLPETSKVYATEYGLKQSMNDSVAGVKLDAFNSETEYLEEAQRRAYKRRDQILTGQTPRGSAVDPLLVAAAEAGVSREAMMAFITSQAKKKAA